MSQPARRAVSSGYRWRDDPFLGWRLATYATLLLAIRRGLVVHGRAHPGMDMSMGPGGAVFFMVTWVVMMAAMMFPSVAPMVATYVSIQRGRGPARCRRRAGGTAFFVGGLPRRLVVAGLLCYAVLRAGQVVAGDSGFWQEDGRWVSVGVLALAAVYELTPAKYACLRRCRGPVAFILEHWRDGRLGALRMGAVHGLWCVGCCWGLMAALVALGMMSLGWMAVVAAPDRRREAGAASPVGHRFGRRPAGTGRAWPWRSAEAGSVALRRRCGAGRR